MKIEIDTENPDNLAALVAMVGRRDVTTGPAMKEALERTFHPIPPEPPLLGTLVRDADGGVHIKAWMDGPDSWNRVEDSAEENAWEDLPHPVVVLSQGYEDAVWR